ncbi:holin [bacterium 1XD21-13]|nr:holin [bacterium 1XD21-13]
MIVLTILGTGSSFIINALLGGWTEDLATLLIFMGIDFAMGLMIAAIWQQSEKSESGALNSISAWKGLCRKGCSLLVIMVAYRLDVTLQVNYIKTAVIIAFIVNEGISIVENYGIMGGPMPNILRKALGILQEKSDNAEADRRNRI